MRVELRSDTFTKPSADMLNAMMSAEVGDDVFSEDPTVNELESFAAKAFGMESAVFCASGTMTNQIAIKTHTQPGDEVITEFNNHVYYYEAGGIAFNSGCQVKTINGSRGFFTANDVLKAINPDDIHRAPTRLVSVENTSNRGGGACYEWEDLVAIRNVCDEHNLKFHLDGARLFNALIAKHQTAEQYGKLFDSISICLSKGLGAPVGSLLLGNAEFIKKARRYRKIFGGGMRQAGFLAAAGLFALKNNINRLQVDHKNAKLIAQELLKKDFIGKMMPVETNILIFEVKGRYNPKSFVEKMKSNNIHCMAMSPTQVRMVTHLDLTQEMVRKTIEVIEII